MSTFLFDIGGTNTRCAIATSDGISDPIVFRTAASFEGEMELFKGVVEEHFPEVAFERVVGCIAGRVDESGVIFGARNLANWTGCDFDDALGAIFNAPVHIENDGALVGLGEAVYGAGKDFSRVAYVTVSTGVGGALIVNESIDYTHSELAVGRIVVGEQDLEESISGTAVRKKFGIHPKDLSDEGERSTLATIFADGLATLVEAWTPEVVVCGGSMIVGENPIPLEVVSASLQERGIDIPIKKALLKDVGGLWGGKALSERL